MAGVGVTRVTDCPVCLGTFKDPRVLPCGHTFCLGCITEHGRSKGSDPDCPNCRTKFQIPSSGFEGLPKNYSLNSVLCETTRAVDISKAKVTNGSCKKHSGEDLVLYCVQCNMVICLDCMEEDHKKHDCSKISRFAKEARTQLETYVKSIKPILSQVTSQKAQLQEKSKKFCDLLDVTELAINEEYDKNKRLLDDHRRLLLEELSNEKQRVAKDLKMKSDEIETEQLSLASFNTRIEEMLTGADEATTFDIVCQYKDLKEIFQKLKQTQPLTMGHVSITGIEFIPGDFKDFIGRRENMIGRLQMKSDSQASGGSFTFKTRCGLTVHVSKGDIVDQSLDVIVSPATENLSNEGGTARAIAKAAGHAFQRECDEYIRKNGKLDIFSVMHTSGGNLRPKIKYVIHTVGPRDSDAKDDNEALLALVKLAVFRCINYANNHLKVRSLAIPALSSGTCGVPIEIVGRASFEALTKFDEYCVSSKNNNTVREIHFLNNDEATVSNMKKIFLSLMTHESSTDPEQLEHVRETLDLYARLTGRQRIETTPDDNCFTRAFATALQKDLQYRWDWQKVDDAIKKELDSHDNCYKKFQASDEHVTKWSLMNAWEKMQNYPQIESGKVNPDVWINAATNALKVQIVLVQLSESQETVERNVKSLLSECDKTVYLAYHWCGHHHFDALVKKASLEGNDSGKKMTAGAEDGSAKTKK